MASIEMAANIYVKVSWRAVIVFWMAFSCEKIGLAKTAHILSAWGLRRVRVKIKDMPWRGLDDVLMG